MNILKIGLIAAVLWQGPVGYAEVWEDDEVDIDDAQSLLIRQLCDNIIENGNTAYEYLDGIESRSISNTFRIRSKEWYMLRGVNRVLEDVVVHPALYFLRYKYNGENVTGVELSCDANANIPDGVLQKAISLSPSAAHINIPMQKLPYPTPKPWKNNLQSLIAPGLKHVRGEAFAGDYDDYYKIRSVDLSSAESIGYLAFYRCDSLNSLKLSNALKFINNGAFYWHSIFSLNIPYFIHFLSNRVFLPYDESSEYTPILSTADLLRPVGDDCCNHSLPISPVILNITCYNRINNIKPLLEKILYYSDNTKSLNIRIGDSIKGTVTTNYINEILAMNSSDCDLLYYMVENSGRGLLDISNIEISEDGLHSLTKDGDLPWVLSLPHIATVDASFNGLFQQLHGVILDTGLVREGAFDECSGLTTLGFRDTTVFEGTPLAELTPSILELTVTQPQNVPCFLSALEWAGLGLSSIEQFIIKFSDAVAQDANLGPYVASLLAVLPPPPLKFLRKFSTFKY
ncbi:MAG: leucine-rich repeat domain-containing protein [Holosporales bacterium]|jgi:hypothetical protein|nr:leucine-rich repeat domain-containing protein [Holosporales bacterium]